MNTTAGMIISGGYTSGQPATLAFDNNIGTYWRSIIGQMPQATNWIGFVFNKPVSVVEIFMDFGTANTSLRPIDGYVEYSDDGTTWSTAFTFQSLDYTSTVAQTVTSPDFFDDGTGQISAPIDLETYAGMVQRLSDLLDKQDAALYRILVKAAVLSTNTYALDVADAGKQMRIQYATQASIALPNNAEVGTLFLVRQVGTGALKFVPDTGGTLVHRLNHNGTAGQFACVRLTCEANANGNSAVWVLDGDTGQLT